MWWQELKKFQLHASQVPNPLYYLLSLKYFIKTDNTLKIAWFSQTSLKFTTELHTFWNYLWFKFYFIEMIGSDTEIDRTILIQYNEIYNWDDSIICICTSNICYAYGNKRNIYTIICVCCYLKSFKIILNK